MLKDFASDVTANLLDLSSQLPQIATQKRRIILAYSGGLDSSALLRVLSSDAIAQSFSVVAAHLNHNMQGSSVQWAEHCRSAAMEHGVSYVEHSINFSPKLGDSSEAWAREQRYQWFNELLGAGDLLLTAHHQDDQLETFFLQLIRGAGPHGLGGIRKLREFGQGYLARPMINKTRLEVEAYLNSEGIAYIEDPSNKNSDFDRNYLRIEILPQLRKRWPHIATSVLHASEIQQVVADDLDERADEFLNAKRSKDGVISRADLLAVPDNFRFSIMRQWCQITGVQLLERRHFDEIEKAVFARSPNPTLSIEWKNAILRFFRGELYLGRREERFDTAAYYSWNMRDSLELPNGILEAGLSLGQGIDTKFRSHLATVGFYQREGERCHPSDRAHSQTLKRLFQEWQVPPWERDRSPIVWIDGRIAAVVPYCICRDFVAAPGKEGIKPNFKVMP